MYRDGVIGEMITINSWLMKKLLGVFLIMFAVGVTAGALYQRAVFKQQVSGHLKNAADASTIPLALEELTLAIDYLEAKGMTEGHTSVLWNTPDEDVGFWYRNLKASQQELQQLQNPTALERTNTLIKLRETLLDTGEKTQVTLPDGISRYPHNIIWFVVGWAAFLGFLVSLILLIPKQAVQSAGLPDATSEP